MSRQILIVDDSRLSRMISRQCILSLHADWRIEEATTGEEAIEKAATTHPWLILLDVNMPGMGGLAAAAILRESHPDAHIVLLTANVQHSVQAQADRLGLGFLAKPIKEPQIHAMLSGLESNV
ncbi:response regulator [Metakosakonia massiliensis]|uniref:Chemotaxis protein CheY n=1 Tax=Phytobacter massiliensis TaxID=1485952 RepID=A0A6N3HMV4_9ENTR|nr:response regulator [Phytobacter massiliensis]